MAKIVFIGAASAFGWVLSRDIISQESLRGGTLCLCDINATRLKDVETFVRGMLERHGLEMDLVVGTNRRTMLPGATVVVTAIAVGGMAYSGRIYHDEIAIPRRYGLEQTIGDTVNPAGVFRFLRTMPVQEAICRDMEDLCPEALLLNYTNPMAMMTWATSAVSGIAQVGLCHSVQHTCASLCEYIGESVDGVRFDVAGINHQAWVMGFRRDGVDLMPRLRACLDDPEILQRDRIRFEIMRHFGCFVTESSKHMSEYVPYFRRSPELMAAYGLEPRELPAQEDRYLNARVERNGWMDTEGNIFPADLETEAQEFASHIVSALVTGQPYVFAGNVMNHGLIDNLLQGACVEVPCMVDRQGLKPCRVGVIPTACAALNRTNLNVIELAVEAYLRRDREAVYHACALDPLTSATVSLNDCRRMVDDLFETEGELLAYIR